MMIRFFSCMLCVCFLCSSLFSQEEKTEFQKQLQEVVQGKKHYSKEELRADIAKAQEAFEEAKQTFDPWYAGPLLTPSAHNVAPGHLVVQPYFFFTSTYAVYDGDRRVKSIPTLFTFNPSLVLQTGIIKWLDITVIPQGIYNHQSSQSSFNVGDTPVTLGFQLLTEGPYMPALRLAISESLPTGKYDNLNPTKHGVDAMGSGSYVTKFTLSTSKVIWWLSSHPFAVRGAFSYGIPAPTNVSGFNTYGGGYGTRGKVHPGNVMQADVAAEYSITKHWVAALDIVYSYFNHSTFSGKKGTNADGTSASTGSPSGDQLSLAPTIEYNFSGNLGILAGVWFTVTGRNSGDFISGVLSVEYFY